MYTPEFHFYLKNVQSNVSTLIYLQAKFNKNRLMLTTGEKILPEHWDYGKQRAVIGKNRVEYSAINDWLNKVEMTAKEFFRNCRYDGIVPDAELIKNYLQKTLNINPEPIKVEPVKKVIISFFDFIDKYIEDEKNNKAIATIKVYKTTKNHLLNYCKVHGKKDILFDDIDATFYNTLIQYLNDLGLAKNSVGKQIKVVKTLLTAASDHGINKNQFHKSKIFKKPSEDVDKIYLQEEELQKIYALDLTQSKQLELTRDYLIIAAYTGFRFSDFTSLRKEHIDLAKNLISKITIKTKAKVVIPIHPVVKEILEKYNYQLPECVTNQHANRQLKEIAELAEINTDIEIIKTIGGSIVRKVFKKYELVSSHTGRRSFATNAFLAGVPAISIMKITGHSTESAFMSYICIDELENAQHIQNHQFFNDHTFGVAA